MTDRRRILETFERAARASCRELRKADATKRRVAFLKGNGGDFATASDKASEAAATAVLHEMLPGVPLVAEEDETTHRNVTAGSYTTTDPLDGTIIFRLFCDRDFGLTFAYVENGQVEVALVMQPLRNALLDHIPSAGIYGRLGAAFGLLWELVLWLIGVHRPVIYTAIRGEGCFRNGRRYRIASVPFDAGLALAVPVSHAVTFDDYTAVLRKLLPLIGTTRALGCAVANTVEVLEGRAHGYINATNAKVWDIAACGLAVTEAGGNASGLNGEELRWDRLSQPIVISGGFAVHERIVDALAN